MASSLTWSGELADKLQMIPRPRPEEAPTPAGDPGHGEPEVLAPDEAPTPQWLPWLGLALALVLGSWFLATQREEGEATEQRRAEEPVVPSGQVAVPRAIR